MGAVLALSWLPEEEGLATNIAIAAVAAGYRPVLTSRTGWVGVCGPRAPRLHDFHGGLILLGDVSQSPDPTPTRGGGRLDRLRSVVTNYWGRYIALDRDQDGTLRAALRDPSGAIELAAWISGGVQVLSTGTPDWLMQVAPAPVEIDWSGVPALLSDPLAGLTQPPLTGISILDAGEMIDLDTGVRRQIWTPISDGPEVWDARLAQRGLRDRVELCVSALASEVASPGAELSGGVDSAIVASASGDHRQRFGLWLNAQSSRPETDERHYALAVADRLGLELTAVRRVEQALTSESLEMTAGGMRPGFNGADPVFDTLVADWCRKAGIDGLFTGKGGDALFYQGASPAIYADLIKAKGVRGLFSPQLESIARWTRRSSWSVLGEALFRREPGPPAAEAVVFKTSAAAPLHPWMSGADRLGPAKALQLQALVTNLAYATACRRSEAVDMIHPLMAQPLVEWSMRIPTPVLTGGLTDRFLARSAFADRLPATVVWRRSKGDYTATFEREAAASLPFLMAHLLDGLLVRHGVIDPVRLEGLLDRDRLMWAGGGLMLTMAALVESWLRVWERRSSQSLSLGALSYRGSRRSPAAI